MAEEAKRKAWDPAQDQRGLEGSRCGCRHFGVVYTRSTLGSKMMRRRQCRNCGKRVTAWEHQTGNPESGVSPVPSPAVRAQLEHVDKKEHTVCLSSYVRARSAIGVLLVCSSWLTSASVAGEPVDWPRFRGANGDGVAPAGNAHIAIWGDAGPLKLWESSEQIPSSGPNIGVGGCGSVVVSGDRVYVYATPKLSEPLATRTYSKEELGKQGWSPVKLPDGLRQRVEQARVSPERAALKPNEVGEWVKKTKEALLTTEEERKNFDALVNDRLTRGPSALPLELLDKLAAIAGRTFASQAELDKWFDENRIDERARKLVCDAIPTKLDRQDDTIYCLNAASGALVWKRSYPGLFDGDFGRSCTPCVADGRVYVLGSECMLYCLSAKDGAEVWKTKPACGPVEGSSQRWRNGSIQIVDGLAIVQLGILTAVDAATGKPAWTCPEAAGEQSTPTPWVKDGKNYLICSHHSGRVGCVDISAKGKLLWKFTQGPGNHHGSVAVNGDHLVIVSGNKLRGYRLGLGKAEPIWTAEGCLDRGASPLIHKNRVYLGGLGRALCLNLEDGKTLWQGKLDAQEFSSAVLADDKLVVVGEKAVFLLDAAADKYTLLATAAIPVAKYTTPAVVNGRLYIRLKNSIGCFDLSQSAPAKTPLGAGGAAGPAGPAGAPEAAGAAEARKMSLDDCKAVLEKLKADGKIAEFKLTPGAQAGLLKLELSSSVVTDVVFLKGMPIGDLSITSADRPHPSKLASLAGLEGMPLKRLSIWENNVLNDISAIKGAPLRSLVISGTHDFGGPKLTDISALKGMGLVDLALGADQLTDLSPLAGMKLEHVSLACGAKDVNVLKGMPLKSVSLGGSVMDVSGLQGSQLKGLGLHGAAKLMDLSGLKGVPLESIDLSYGPMESLHGLEGMPLKGLLVPANVQDLSPLRDLPALEWLAFQGKKVSDLAPLKGLKKLKSLDLQGLPVSDITPLAGLPVESLNLDRTKVATLGAVMPSLPNLKSLSLQALPIADPDLATVKGLKLASLNIAETKVTELNALKGMALESLNLCKTQVKDLSPVAGPALKYLIASDCPNLQDLTPLADCKELEGVVLPPKFGDIEFLRKMPKLKFLTAQPLAWGQRVQDRPAADFWKKYDEGKK